MHTHNLKLNEKLRSTLNITSSIQTTCLSEVSIPLKIHTVAFKVMAPHSLMGGTGYQHLGGTYILTSTLTMVPTYMTISWYNTQQHNIRWLILSTTQISKSMIQLYVCPYLQILPAFICNFTYYSYIVSANYLVYMYLQFVCLGKAQS
jgi:hypothetical protein